MYIYTHIYEKEIFNFLKRQSIFLSADMIVNLKTPNQLRNNLEVDNLVK
jgi:uncharacterized protein (DUF927 family)